MARDCDIVVDREFQEQLRILKRLDYSRSRDGMWTEALDLCRFPQNATRARSQNAGNQIEQRGLTRPVRAEDADDLPRRDGERRVRYGREPTEALRQLDDLKQHGASPQACRSRLVGESGWSESAPSRRVWLGPRRRGRRYAEARAARRRQQSAQ